MYRNIIQESIEYIETHLKSELTVKELSERAGFSLFHYYRVFQSVVGMPVMQYILRRRLLNGIYEISCGNKMIDVAFIYGFDTYAGFYKAFLREFGYTPAQFLKTYKVKKPYGINLFQQEHRMVTHKKIAEILKNWGLEKEQISDIFYEGSGNRNDSAFYVGEQYVIKFSANMQTLKTHMELSKALGEAGLWSALPVKTLDGKDHIAEDGLFYCLTRRLAGQQLQVGDLYEEGGMTKARYIGEVLGQAIPYVVLSNQLIATAWFMEQDKYRELYEINRSMTEWMAGRFEKLKIK